MKMLDNNLEHEPGQGSFFIRELDEEVIRQNDQHFELVQFAYRNINQIDKRHRKLFIEQAQPYA